MQKETERCIARGETEYPKALLHIRNAPKNLYVRGSLPSERMPTVAIIGARGCSVYGREMAQWFGRELALAGVQVVSGMARGVDGIAQMAALQAGGRSYGVLGCGTDVCYPKENRRLYELLVERGGIVSEHPSGTQPLPSHFPSRNRIISAISDCVLVIEAKERSGTLITADFALEQGKEVYALPGRLTDALSDGCNRLLWQGAGLALSPDCILELLAGMGSYSEWGTGRKAGKEGMRKEEKTPAVKTGQNEEASQKEKLNQKEWLIWEQVGDRSIGLQELYEKIRMTEEGKTMELGEVMEVLMELVMRKIILPERGNKYCRKNKNGVSTI